jgi:hypothetical protein
MRNAPQDAALPDKGPRNSPIQLLARPLRLNYFIRIPNVGDRTNPGLVTAITGLHTIHSEGKTGHLLAIGSILGASTPESHVWGTGIIHPNIGCGAVRPERVYALRGQLSLAAMRSAGLVLRDVPLGDPGYLAPRLLGVRKAARPAFRLGIVPHYVDSLNQHMVRIGHEPGVRVLDVHDDPLKFLHDMADCETIISSSLHGLVFAEGLGIPNLWVSVGGDIVGGTFKFKDWFSTTACPQQAPVELDTMSTAADLANMARLHESLIDEAALVDAFPDADLFREPQESRFVPVGACRSSALPVFLISRNRGLALHRSVQAIKALAASTQIVILHQGSGDAVTLSTLERLQTNGAIVHRSGNIDAANEEDWVQERIASFFADWGEPQRYVVSDCEIDMSIADSAALDVYDELLNRFRNVGAVGPMVRVRDVPRSYPSFAEVMNRHIQQFWRHTPEFTATAWGPVAFQRTVIDTTFALHRAGEPFRRLKGMLRIYEPYEARHLDWHITALLPTPDVTSSSNQISHLDNTSEMQRGRDAPPLKFESYLVVERDSAGSLRVLRRYPRDHLV